MAWTFRRPRSDGNRGRLRLGKLPHTQLASTKLVKEVSNFLGEVAQLAELAEAHLISAHHLLPPQRPPTDIVLSPASKMECDFTQAFRAGPNIAADPEAAALLRVLGLLAHVEPPPVRSQRHLNGFTSIVCHVL